MYSASSVNSFHTALNDFQLDGMMMRYSRFVPRLYNYCLSLGMTSGKIMPSRAFCSDESQGFPIILLAKHFGTFPFNHGLVGGVVATDRHGPHAAHGKDMVIIQASHVGYDPEHQRFGIYRRMQSADCHHSTNCGKIAGILQSYKEEYEFAQQNILLEHSAGVPWLAINNLLLQDNRKTGLFLQLPKLIKQDAQGNPELVRSLSTARCFAPSEALLARIPDWPTDGSKPIGNYLTPDMFSFKRELEESTENQSHLERNLLHPMPWIISHAHPALAAAQINTQVEFDRSYRTIISHEGYHGRNLIFISGLNIDISPQPNQLFPLTKFIPWAAYIQTEEGEHRILEQQSLYQLLTSQPVDNPDAVDLELAIEQMIRADEISIPFSQ